jgi:hypothetical protein
MRHWRKMTWAIWAWTALCLLWEVSGFVATSKPATCGGLASNTCTNFANAGRGVGAFAVFLAWLLIFLILSVIWFMTKPQRRICPRCGRDVRKGLTQCKKCGYDYAANLPAGGSAPE